LDSALKGQNKKLIDGYFSFFGVLIYAALTGRIGFDYQCTQGVATGLVYVGPSARNFD
jgi:hypothetical protein